MKESKKGVPDWLVEQLALGELSPERAREVLRSLELEGRLDRLEELARSNREILGAYPPGPVVRRLKRALEAREAPRRLPALALRLGPVLAALVLVVVASPRLLHQGERGSSGGASLEAEEVVRSKGLRPRLVVYRKQGDTAELLHADVVAHPGEVLQLGYVSAGQPFGVIFSIDGRGEVVQHYPARGEQAAPLEGGREVLLPFSYKLDDAPSFERFFIVTSNRPFPLDVALGPARRLARAGEAARATLILPESFTQNSILIQKVNP